MAGGRVVGRTDRTGGEVLDTPISPKDTLATAFHLLGIDPGATVPDRLNRPMRIAGRGSGPPGTVLSGLGGAEVLELLSSPHRSL